MKLLIEKENYIYPVKFYYFGEETVLIFCKEYSLYMSRIKKDLSKKTTIKIIDEAFAKISYK